ncbi:hypothetical protein GN956_G24375 [Arapaima gigas]
MKKNHLLHLRPSSHPLHGRMDASPQVALREFPRRALRCADALATRLPVISRRFGRKMPAAGALTLGLLLGTVTSVTLSHGNASRRPDVTPQSGGVLGGGGLASVPESTVSPAFGATVMIIVTVVVSASAYLCFLKYVCSGCCGTPQVAPNHHLDPSKAEEQV